MIAIFFVDGDRGTPFLRCSVCGKRIDSARRAIVIWESDQRHGHGSDRYAVPVFVHKGNCANSFEKRRDTQLGRMELQAFLTALTTNSSARKQGDDFTLVR